MHEAESHRQLKLPEKKRQYIVLRPLLQHPSLLKKYAFTLDDSGVARVSTINDLFCDAAWSDVVSEEVHILLELVDMFNRSAPTDPMVVIRSGVKDKDSGGPSQFYRIGYVPRKQKQQEAIPTSETFFWHQSGKGSTSPTKSKDPDHFGTPKRVKASIWTLRGLDICKLSGFSNVTNEIIPAALQGKTKEVPWAYREFEPILSDGSISSFADGRLLYSFKTFGTLGNSCPTPVKKFPSSGVSAAIRFVTHLEDAEARKVVFFDTLELELDGKDDEASIIKGVKARFTEDDEGNTGNLLKKPLRDQWKMQL